MPFDQIQCADLSGWSGDGSHPGWRKAALSVGDLVRRAAAHNAAPEPAAAASPRVPVLAVLAFDNLSDDPKMAYFSDGVSEEIQHTLARGTGLRVIGRASSFQFRGAEKAASKVAAALKATHILDGSLRRSGSQVRISAQLVECSGETTIWSDHYDRELSDVFALQDAIAASVAAALKRVFTPQRGGRRIDPDTYDLFLKNRGSGMPSRVVAALEEVTTRAPEFARGWAWLGGSLCAQARFFETDPHRKDELFSRAENAARRALALDPGMSGAYSTLADAEPLGAWSRVDAHLMRGLEQSPDIGVLQARANYLACVGRVREALEIAEQGFAVDPLWMVMAWRRSMLLWLSGSSEATRFAKERALRPNAPGPADWALNAVCAEDWASFAELEKTAPSEDFLGVPRILKWGRAIRDRDAAAADRIVQESEERLAAYGGLPFEDYLFLWKLERVDTAFDFAARSTYERRLDRTRDTMTVYQTDILFFSGAYRGLINDPRVVQLFAKLGLCDYWAASDRWPDCAEASLLPYDFKHECMRLSTGRHRS
jgi:TolB-like protein